MEIKLNGWQAGTIMGCVIAEAVVGFVALHKWKKERERANDAELRTMCREIELGAQNIHIKSLERKITELESKS